MQQNNAQKSPSVVDFLNTPYSPILLLEAPFDITLMHAPEFAVACEWGFHAYFNSMYEAEEGYIVFVEEHYNHAYVVRMVTDWIIRDMDPPAEPPFVWPIGFTLGWLSALALTERELAVYGLKVLIAVAMPMLQAQQVVAFALMDGEATGKSA